MQNTKFAYLTQTPSFTYKTCSNQCF